MFFKETDACKRLLNVIVEEPTNATEVGETIVAFKCLINLTQDKFYVS